MDIRRNKAKLGICIQLIARCFPMRIERAEELFAMCTAVTYQTKDFYFGRTLDYEFSYGDEVTITPRRYNIIKCMCKFLNFHTLRVGNIIVILFEPAIV